MAKITNEKVREAFANFRSSKRKQMETYLNRMNNPEAKLPKIFGELWNTDTDEIETCLRVKSGQYGIADVFLNGRSKKELLEEMISQTYMTVNPDGYFLKEFLGVYLDNRIGLSPDKTTSAKRLSKTKVRNYVQALLEGKEVPDWVTGYLTNEGS